MPSILYILHLHVNKRTNDKRTTDQRTDRRAKEQKRTNRGNKDKSMEERQRKGTTERPSRIEDDYDVSVEDCLILLGTVKIKSP